MANSIETELSRRAHLGISVSQRAGEILREYRAHVGPADHKGAVDLVTDADRASQDYLETAIREAFPHDAFVAEEGHRNIVGTSEFQWVVDPLDGTTNYVHGYAPFAVSVGLLFAGEPVFGAVFVVSSDELFLARRGRGAFCNGRPLRVSSTPQLESALLATGFPYDRRERLHALLQPVSRALATAQGLRRSGAASVDLCHVANGGLDGYWEPGLAPWDMAAGCVIVQEAGGRVTDYSGHPHDLWGREVVASNGLIHGALLESVVRGGGDEA